MKRGGYDPRGRGRGRGQPSRSAETYANRHHPVVGANSYSETPFDIRENMDPPYGNRSSQPRSVGSSLKRYNHPSIPRFMYRQVRHSPGAKDLSSGVEKLHLVEEANSHSETPFDIRDNMDPPDGNRSSQPRSVGNSLKQYNHANTPRFIYRQVHHSPGAKDLSSGVEKLHLVEEALTPISAICSRASVSSSEKVFPSSSLTDKSLNSWRPRKGKVVDDGAKSGGSLVFEPSPAVDNTSSVSGSSLEGIPYHDISRCELTPQKKVEDSGQSEDSGHQTMGATFDICPPRSGAVITLKPSLHMQNRMRRDEAKRCMEGQTIIELRSGMILLKKYLSFSDQVKIVRECRELGLGPGGFYEPGFRDGGKLHLMMMCLGKNWDPEKSEYGDVRPSDGVKPPLVPRDFHRLVKGTIEASHSFLSSKVVDVGCILPSMSPNICIVNFYTKSGRLGLHKDKDESAESISRGLPVVSFSIGDSAEFLYGDQRDPDKAAKVVLESGDVLIFGGKSRLVFHGVTSIQSDTAPKALLEETCLRPGRLNLTFRES